MARLPLSMALSNNPNTRPLIDGAVEAEGLDLTATVLHPSEMFWRQLRFAEFDVSEMSMSSLLISTARSPTPWVALPVFTTRELFHTRILVRADAGIASPADLRGKRGDVPEEHETAATCARCAPGIETAGEPRSRGFYSGQHTYTDAAAGPGAKPPRAH